MYAILDEVTCMTLKTESSISLRLRYHTLIHTFAIFEKPQYLGLNLENAEFLVLLFSFQYFVLSFGRGKCELRNVIQTFALTEMSVHLLSLVILCPPFPDPLRQI